MWGEELQRHAVDLGGFWGLILGGRGGKVCLEGLGWGAVGLERIRRVKGDFVGVGGSGEHGGYQWIYGGSGVVS